ncbi:MAG: hypothetical protein ACRDE2_06810 [Chitinophagaceae bacterium]
MGSTIQTTETKLYEALRDLIGKDKAEEAVLSVKRIANVEAISETKLLATKDDLSQTKTELKDDISQAKDELKDNIFQVKSELKDNIRTLDEKLETTFRELAIEIKNTEVRTMERITGVIKSVYFVGVVQFLAIIASIIVILQLFLK